MSDAPDWWKRPRKFSVVVDNDSWILPYASELVEILAAGGDDAVLRRRYADVEHGVAAFFLGCVGIAPRSVLARNRYNLVVHESDLPKGRGFAPIAWSVLSGSNEFTACLIEASADEADAGVIYYRRRTTLRGNELNTELRALQGATTLELCRQFSASEHPPTGTPQEGDPTFYRRRTPVHSRLDPYKTIAEQFELLRVVDNDRYPAFFDFRGRRYVLQISDDGPSGEASET